MKNVCLEKKKGGEKFMLSLANQMSLSLYVLGNKESSCHCLPLIKVLVIL